MRGGTEIDAQLRLQLRSFGARRIRIASYFWSIPLMAAAALDTPPITMAIFDRFRSRPDEDSAQSSSSELHAPQEVLRDQQPSQYQGELLKDSSGSSSGPSGFAVEDAPVFYNPYEGLSAAIDNRSARGGYKLSKQPEFLFSEEATVHRRGWGENITYYTGSGYLTGEEACIWQQAGS